MEGVDFLSERIMPQVIGLVISQDQKLNVCPINWQVVSTKYETPMTVCIGLSHGHYTLETITNSHEFVFAYPHSGQLKDTLYCGTISGRNENKLEKTEFRFTPSTKIQVPCLEDAVLNLECTVHSMIDMGNYTIIVGLVQEIHESSDSSLKKIYSLGGQNYGSIEKVNVLQQGRT